MREYARKALTFPLEPPQKLILYVYMGDAFQVEDWQKPFPAKRAKAVVPYLEGLKETQRQHLPAKAPESPPVGASDIPPSDPGYAEYKRQHVEALRAWEVAQAQKKMIGLRDVLVHQIVGLYTRPPYATEELKSIATNILGEGKEFDHLMAAVNDKVAKLPPGERQDETPMEAIAPAMRSKYLYLSIALGVGAVIAVVLLLLARRGRENRGAKSNVTQKI